MSLIADIEDAIIAKAEDLLGNTVKEVVSIEGGWTLDMLKRALQFAPSVYVAFLGAKRGVSEGYHNGRFAVYVVTRAALAPARRRGTTREIGAYDIIELLSRNLDGMSVADIGTLTQQSIDNLFRDAMFELGGSVYGLMYEAANMPLGYEADETTLDDFITFHADHDINQDGEVDAADTVTGLNQ
jgi:phage gp37-like protein